MGYYLFCLQEYSTQNSFISSTLLISLIGICIGFIPITIIASHLLDNEKLLLLIFTSSILIIIVMLFMKPIHMMWNIILMATNMNPVFWGFLGILIGLVGIIYVRDILSNKDNCEVTVFGNFFILALILTFMLTFFRSPLRFGMNDSINRIMIQIIPAFLPVCVFYLTQNKAFQSVSKRIFGN